MKTPQLSLSECLAIAYARDPQTVIHQLMANGRGGPLYSQEELAAAAAVRERAEAAFAQAEKVHPLAGSVN